jgi:hypothetical protein
MVSPSSSGKISIEEKLNTAQERGFHLLILHVNTSRWHKFEDIVGLALKG